MKRAFLPCLAALAALLLLSSCAYDPLYGGYYGSSYYGSSYYGSPSVYSGGYYNGVYSDFYVGFYNNHYRYRHTRCSLCNHYPCRGGHHARYHTYYRTYAKPLHYHPDRGRGRHHASHDDRYRSHSVSPRARPSSYRRDYRDGGSRYSGVVRDQRNRPGGSPATSRKTNPSINYGTLRNATPYRSPSRSATNRSTPKTLVTSPSRSAPRVRSPQVSQPAPSARVRSAPPSSSSRKTGTSSGGSSSSRSSPFSRNSSKKFGGSSQRGPFSGRNKR